MSFFTDFLNGSRDARAAVLERLHGEPNHEGLLRGRIREFEYKTDGVCLWFCGEPEPVAYHFGEYVILRSPRLNNDYLEILYHLLSEITCRVSYSHSTRTLSCSGRTVTTTDYIPAYGCPCGCRSWSLNDVIDDPDRIALLDLGWKLLAYTAPLLPGFRQIDPFASCLNMGPIGPLRPRVSRTVSTKPPRAMRRLDPLPLP